MLLSISRSFGRSGDDPELGARKVAAGFVDQLLSVAKAASALRLVAKHLVRLFGRSQPAPGELAKFVFGDGVADAYDHGRAFTDNANYSQDVTGHSQLLICSSGFFLSA